MLSPLSRPPPTPWCWWSTLQCTPLVFTLKWRRVGWRILRLTLWETGEKAWPAIILHFVNDNRKLLQAPIFSNWNHLYYLHYTVHLNPGEPGQLPALHLHILSHQYSSHQLQQESSASTECPSSSTTHPAWAGPGPECPSRFQTKYFETLSLLQQTLERSCRCQGHWTSAQPTDIAPYSCFFFLLPLIPESGPETPYTCWAAWWCSWAKLGVACGMWKIVIYK